MDIILNTEEINYLNEKKFLTPKLMEYIKFATKISSENYAIDIDENDALKIREKCADELMICGFDDNYTPTHEGTILENLIDKFYVP